MEIGIRAARTQVANERIAEAAPRLAERFGVKFSPATLQRFDHDPANRALFFTEGVADFLDELMSKTGPAAALPSSEDRTAGLTVAELRQVIEATDEPADLDAIEAAERAGKDRAGVMKALEERRAALAPAEGEAAVESDDPDDADDDGHDFTLEANAMHVEDWKD